MTAILHGVPHRHHYTAALFLALCGCTEVPLNQSTRELSMTSAMGIPSGDSIVPPSPSRTVRPQYPVEMRKAGISGTVRLDIVVDAAGAVQSVAVLDSDEESFRQPAIDAVRRWTFTPGRHNGVSVPMRISLPISFKLDDD